MADCPCHDATQHPCRCVQPPPTCGHCACIRRALMALASRLLAGGSCGGRRRALAGHERASVAVQPSCPSGRHRSAGQAAAQHPASTCPPTCQSSDSDDCRDRLARLEEDAEEGGPLACGAGRQQGSRRRWAGGERAAGARRRRRRLWRPWPIRRSLPTCPAALSSRAMGDALRGAGPPRPGAAQRSIRGLGVCSPPREGCGGRSGALWPAARGPR